MTVTTLPAGTTTYTAHTTVAAGDTLRFPPNSSATLVMNNRNLIIEGILEMLPSGPNQNHLLQFTNVNEANFVGGAIGGMGTPLDTDIGLWVMNQGKLNAIGSPKAGWNRTGDHSTWASTDEMYKTPWAVGDFSIYAAHAKGGALQSFVAPDGSTQTQEAFNLTRNVRIEGTPGHNTHFFCRTDVAQTIKYVQFRHVGPRVPAGGGNISNNVRGRWGIHLHHLGNAGYDTLIEGCVVRDNPTHAFVAHGSHGVTFRDCVGFNVAEDCYWWDADVASDASFDVTYDHCMVAKLIPIPAFRGYLMTGFVASHGSGTMTDCVVTGNLGNVNAPAFQWPEDGGLATGHGLWANSGNVAHNNKRLGMYYWQNDAKPHHIEYFTAFRNGAHGIVAGAYVNAVTWDHLLLFQNPGGDLLINAGTIAVPPLKLSFKQVYTDELLFREHSFGGAEITRLDDSTFNHATINETPLVNAPDTDPEVHYDLVNTDLEPSDWDVQFIGPNSFYRIQRANGTAYQITDDGISVIPAFADVLGSGTVVVGLTGSGTGSIGGSVFRAGTSVIGLTGSGTGSITGGGSVAASGTGLARLTGLGTVAGAAPTGASASPFRLRSLRGSSRLRGAVSAHLRGEGGPAVRAAFRLRPLSSGGRLRSVALPSSLRAGGLAASTGEGTSAVQITGAGVGSVADAGTGVASLTGSGIEGRGDLGTSVVAFVAAGSESLDQPAGSISTLVGGGSETLADADTGTIYLVGSGTAPGLPTEGTSVVQIIGSGAELVVEAGHGTVGTAGSGSGAGSESGAETLQILATGAAAAAEAALASIILASVGAEALSAAATVTLHLTHTAHMGPGTTTTVVVTSPTRVSVMAGGPTRAGEV